ncbi:hypothetical protein BH11MYX1_BH11MYX1_09830 [soil metagenome]
MDGPRGQGDRTGTATISLRPSDYDRLREFHEIQSLLSEELSLLRRHPIVIGGHLLERFGRSNDDALVLVAK